MNDTAASHRFRPAGPLRGSITVPGDKSISHRSLILGAMAVGETNQGIVVRRASRLTARALANHAHARSPTPTQPLSSPRRAARVCARRPRERRGSRPGGAAAR